MHVCEGGVSLAGGRGREKGATPAFQAEFTMLSVFSPGLGSLYCLSVKIACVIGMFSRLTRLLSRAVVQSC